MTLQSLIDLYAVHPASAAHVTGARIALAWGLALSFLALGAYTLKLFDFRPAKDRSEVWLTDTRLPLAVSLSVAVGEELVFRGYLQSRALDLMPEVYALFAVNLVFAAIHYKGGLTFAMSAGFFGMLASIMTLASASLAPAIVMHVGWNLLVALARRREDERLAAIEAAPVAECDTA